MLLLVNVHRMHPPATSVADLPDLVRALLHAGQLARRVPGFADTGVDVLDAPLELATEAAAHQLEDTSLIEQLLPLARREVRDRAKLPGDKTVVRRVVADHDLQHGNLVGRIRRVPHATILHLHDIGQVDDIALAGWAAVLVQREVDDELAPFGRPDLEPIE